MVVAASQESGAGGRTECGCVKLIVAQSVLRQTIHGGRRDRSTERGRCSETNIIGEDEKNIRGVSGGFDSFWEVLHRLLGDAANLALEGWWRDRQLSPVRPILGDRRERCDEENRENGGNFHDWMMGTDIVEPVIGGQRFGSGGGEREKLMGPQISDGCFQHPFSAWLVRERRRSSTLTSDTIIFCIDARYFLRRRVREVGWGRK